MQKKNHKKRENHRVFLKREGSLKCNQIRFIISARLCSLRIDFVYKFVCVWLTRPQHRHAFIFFFQYVHIQYNMAIMRHKLYRICGEESIWRRKRKKKKLGGESSYEANRFVADGAQSSEKRHSIRTCCCCIDILSRDWYMWTFWSLADKLSAVSLAMNSQTT